MNFCILAIYIYIYIYILFFAVDTHLTGNLGPIQDPMQGNYRHSSNTSPVPSIAITHHSQHGVSEGHPRLLKVVIMIMM